MIYTVEAYLSFSGKLNTLPHTFVMLFTFMSLFLVILIKYQDGSSMLILWFCRRACSACNYFHVWVIVTQKCLCLTQQQKQQQQSQKASNCWPHHLHLFICEALWIFFAKLVFCLEQRFHEKQWRKKKRKKEEKNWWK